MTRVNRCCICEAKRALLDDPWCRRCRSLMGRLEAEMQTWVLERAAVRRQKMERVYTEQHGHDLDPRFAMVALHHDATCSCDAWDFIDAMDDPT